MTDLSTTGGGRESFLLDLLRFAGWKLQVRAGKATLVRATRAGVLVEVEGATLGEAAGIAFARAMRSSRPAGQRR